MESELKQKVFSEAVKRWGVDTQVSMAIEEMSELIKELCKLKRKNYHFSDESIQPLIEEIADVRLMVDQVAYMFEIVGNDMYEEKLRHIARKLGVTDGK